MLTKRLSAVVRTLIDALRTLSVWLVEIIIFYGIAPDSGYGEGWHQYSWLQVIGFALLVLGTLIYNSIIKFPCFNYDHKKPQSREAAMGESPSSPGNQISWSPPTLAGSPRFSRGEDKRSSRKFVHSVN